MPQAVGLDFGTTNSAIAVVDRDAAPRLARFPIADETTSTFRSLLFFSRDEEGGASRVRSFAGPRAIEEYLAAEEPGRLMQSLKSFLASRGFSSTDVLGKTYRLEGLIEIILRDLRSAAEEQFGTLPDRVVAGRPVRFANAGGPEDDELALARLEAAYHNAGFPEVVFEYEPVAAAYEYRRRLEREELILIADFGGGTSDFCLLRLAPGSGQGAKVEILGTAGLPVAGDAFDAQIVRHVVAPRLGREAEYRSIFDRVLRVPLWIYSHVERWHRLSFLKSRSTMQLLFDLRREALEPEKFDALIHVVVNDLGFLLYRSVERKKHELSGSPKSVFCFRDAPVNMEEVVIREDFEGWIAEETAALGACVDRVLGESSVRARRVDRVFMTGGSSFVPAVRSLFVDRFGEDRIRSGNELTSVASGLALRALEID